MKHVVTSRRILGFLLVLTVLIGANGAIAYADSGPVLTVGSAYNTSPGDIVEIPITIMNMNDLLMMQFALSYDQTYMNYLGYQNGPLLEYQVEPTVNASTPGKIYYVWDSTESLPDSGTVVTFQFKVTDSAVRNAEICIDENEEIFFADSDYQIISPSFVAGHIVIFDFCLPIALETIGESAFEGGAFGFIRLSDNTKSIGPRAFADCSNLAYIIIPENTATINSNAFDGVSGLTILGVPKSRAESFALEKGFSFVAID